MRKITCYIYDSTDSRYVTEYLVTIGTKEGYSKPTVGDVDELVEELESKLHKSEMSLRRMANNIPFDLDITIDDRGSEHCPEHLQDQHDEYCADSVRHLR